MDVMMSKLANVMIIDFMSEWFLKRNALKHAKWNNPECNEQNSLNLAQGHPHFYKF
jgi:hypothetical protein